MRIEEIDCETPRTTAVASLRRSIIPVQNRTQVEVQYLLGGTSYAGHSSQAHREPDVRGTDRE